MVVVLQTGIFKCLRSSSEKVLKQQTSTLIIVKHRSYWNLINYWGILSAESCSRKTGLDIIVSYCCFCWQCCCFCWTL